MKQLIITADDFGITKSVNEGIAKALKDGVLNYVSCLPSGDAYDDASARIRALGLKEIGAHLALTEMSCVSDPAKIPTLVACGRKFYKGRVAFFSKFLLSRIKTEEIYLELKAQVELLKKTGLSITCLSGHEHIHMMPAILEIFIKLAKEYNIPAIRYMNDNSRIGGFCPLKGARSLIQSYYKSNMKKALDSSGIRHADSLLGFIDSGKVGEETLLRLISGLPDGVTELVMHPGFMGPEVLERYKFHKNCELELYALTSERVKRLIRDSGVKFVTFKNIIY